MIKPTRKEITYIEQSFEILKAKYNLPDKQITEAEKEHIANNIFLERVCLLAAGKVFKKMSEYKETQDLNRRFFGGLTQRPSGAGC